MKLASMVLFSLGSLFCTASSAQQAAEPYALQPGDVILISVLEDSLLDRQTLVAPDGRISMPLAGSVIASGLTPEQLEAALRKRLRSKFVEPPNVTVSLVSLNQKDDDEEIPREIYVLGEVNSPGRYTYDPETEITALQALTLAGGLSTFAAENRIQIRQREGNTETLRLFDYEALENGVISSSTDLDALQDGAIIIVPERGLFD